MIPTSSSSSTLSPLAPPFTVDRPHTNPLLHPHRYPPPSAAAFDADDSALGRPAAESSSWMDPSVAYNSLFSGGGSAERFMAYGDAYGVWHGKHVDSSTRPVHIGANSSAWRDGYPEIYEGKAMDSYNNGLSYFHIPNPNIPMDDCDISNSNRYDRYMSQLVSCSTDPVGCYASKTCTSSAEEFSPARETNTSVYSSPSNRYSTTQCGNLLYNIDDNYVDHMLDNKFEPVIDQFSDNKEGYAKDSIDDNYVEGNYGTNNISVVAGCASVASEVTDGSSIEAVMKCGSRTKQLCFTESVASQSIPSSSLQTSPEILDQPNLSVDSPCWRGASFSQQYMFGGGKMIGCHQDVKETKGYDDLNQVLNCPPVNAQFLKTSYRQDKDGGLGNDNMKGSLTFQENFSSNAGIYATDRSSNDVSVKGPEHAQIREARRSYISCALSDKSVEVKDSSKDSEPVNTTVKQLGQVRTAILSSNSPALDSKGTLSETGYTNAAQDKSSDVNLESGDYTRNISVLTSVGQDVKPLDPTDPSVTGKCPTARKDMKLLVGAMHGLSEVLLSSSDSGGVEWEKHDHELIQLVIDNLKTFTSKNREGIIPKCSSPSPGIDSDQSLVSESKSNNLVKNQRNKSSEDTEGKFNFAGSFVNTDKFDMRRYNGVAQVTGKDLESDAFVQKEENPRAVLYKNLWIQAEAALCSLKYELELTRMKLDVDDQDRHTRAKESIRVMEPPKLNTMHSSCCSVSTTPRSLCRDAINLVENDVETIEVKPKAQKASKDDKVESSVMARLEVLRGRYARSSDAFIEEQPKCSDNTNAYTDLPTKLADLGFMETTGIPHPSNEDGNLGKDLSVYKDKQADSYYSNPNFNEDYALHRGFSDYTFGGVSQGQPADVFWKPFTASTGGQKNPMQFML